MDGFDIPTLVRMEPYLTDEDISVLARCCRRHMILCYLRAVRLFEWGKKVCCLRFETRFLYPTDQFLQLQCAKMMVFSRSEPDMTPSTVLENKPQPNNVDEFMSAFSVLIPMTMSFDTYMRSVCFVDGKEIANNAKRRSMDIKSYRELLAYHICVGDDLAKCSFASQTNKFALYNRLRSSLSRGVHFLFEALSSCTSQHSDVRIFINEIDIVIKSENENIFDCLCTHRETTRVGNFRFYEHPIVARHIYGFIGVGDEFGGMGEISRWFYELLDEPDGIWRCERLRIQIGFTERQVVNCFESLEFCFISEEIDFEDHDAIDKLIREGNISLEPEEIKRLLSYNVTRHAAKAKLRGYIAYLLQKGNMELFNELKKLLVTKW